MKDLEKYLRENAPETPAEGQFLLETSARLSRVEGIKKTVDGEHRRARVAVMAALGVGLVLGCALTALVLLYPPQLDKSALDQFVLALQARREYLFGFIALCAVSLGLLSVLRPHRLPI